MKKLALVAVEFAVLFALLEVAIRISVAPQIDVPHLRVDPHGFYTWYPGARFTYRNLPHVEPPAATVRIDADGLRGPELPPQKLAGERRVLVIGDSYTAAVQLPEDEIFTTLLATELNAARPQARYRVLNAGVNGAGTAHELLYFQHAGAALAPDVVVLQFAWNDVQDTQTHGGFRLTPTGVELRADLRDPPFWRGPLLALRDALGNRSLVFYLGYRAVAQFFGASAARAADVVAVDADAPADAAVASNAGADPAITLVARLAAELVHAANAAGAPVILLTIPEPIYVGGGDPVYAQVVAAFGALVAGTTNQLVVADPLLLAAETRGEATFLAGDGHLSPAGHRVVAAALAAAVLRCDGAS